MGKLEDFAAILRRDSLEATTVADSGHPTSCLSCAEIMSVLFFDEMKYDVKNSHNPDNDEFILSKGHAAPILYSALYRAGCIKTKLSTLRKLNSPLEGHPVPCSLDWVKAATGSLGQGLSIGVGMALAAKIQNRKFRTYVLLGDGEVAEGSIYEALELAVKYKLNNLVAIVDVNRLGQSGETLVGHNIEEYKKRFSGFGCMVIMIDGHNINQILKAFKDARKSTKPVVILAKTFKGRGVYFLENKEGWHGRVLKPKELKMALKEIPNHKIYYIKIKKPVKIFRKIKKQTLKTINYNSEEISTRKAYGETLAKLAKSDSSVIAIDAEVSNSTYSSEVKKARPKQFIEAFIAEQNMIGMALGLSVKGYNVFTSSFAAFLSRAHDQIRMAAISNGDITFCGSHVGVSTGEDGASQMGLEDISIFRSLPNSYVFYPSDAVSTQKLTIACSKIRGIKYLRTTRQKTKIIYNNLEKFPVGDFKILKKSNNDKAVFVGSGITTHEALEAYEKLKNVAVVDIYSIKPFNYNKFFNFVKSHGGKIILAEDHRPEGGIGEMVLEGLSGTNIKIKHLSIKEIPHSGKGKELLKKYGVDASAYVRAFKGEW